MGWGPGKVLIETALLWCVGGMGTPRKSGGVSAKDRAEASSSHNADVERQTGAFSEAALGQEGARASPDPAAASAALDQQPGIRQSKRQVHRSTYYLHIDVSTYIDRLPVHIVGVYVSSHPVYR